MTGGQNCGSLPTTMGDRCSQSDEDIMLEQTMEAIRQQQAEKKKQDEELLSAALREVFQYTQTPEPLSAEIAMATSQNTPSTSASVSAENNHRHQMSHEELDVLLDSAQLGEAAAGTAAVLKSALESTPPPTTQQPSKASASGKNMLTAINDVQKLESDLFCVCPTEENMFHWQLTLKYPTGLVEDMDKSEVQVRLEFTEGDYTLSKPPRIAVVHPRLVGPQIIEGAICFNLFHTHTWDPTQFDFQNLFLAIHAHLQSPEVKVVVGEGYSSAEHERGFAHIRRVHPEWQQHSTKDAETQRSDALALLQSALVAKVEENVFKALMFLTLALQHMPHRECLVNRANIFEELNAWRFAVADWTAAIQAPTDQTERSMDNETLRKQLNSTLSKLQLHTPKVIYVGRGYTTDQVAHPSDHIIHRLDVPSALEAAQDGDRILLYPGLYILKHPLLLVKSVTICTVPECVAEGAIATIRTKGSLLNVLTENAVLQNIRLESKLSERGDISPALFVIGGNLCIDHCTIWGDVYCGLMVENAATICTIKDTVVRGFARGCVVRTRGNLKLLNCEISGQQELGVQAEVQGLLSVNNCKFIDIAVGVSVASVCSVKNTSFEGTNTGVVVWGEGLSVCLIQDSRISTCGGPGVTVRNAKYFMFINNVIHHTKEACVVCEKSKLVCIKKNTLKYSGKTALELRNLEMACVCSNDISNTAFHGIAVQDSVQQLCIQHNNISHCGASAIFVTGSSPIIRNNKLEYATIAAVELRGDKSECHGGATCVYTNTLSNNNVAVTAVRANFNLYSNMMVCNNMGVKMTDHSIGAMVGNFMESIGAAPVGGCLGCLNSAVLAEGNEMFSLNAAAVFVGDLTRKATLRRNIVGSDVACFVVYNNSEAAIVGNCLMNTPRGIEMQCNTATIVAINTLHDVPGNILATNSISSGNTSLLSTTTPNGQSNDIGGGGSNSGVPTANHPHPVAMSDIQNLKDSGGANGNQTKITAEQIVSQYKVQSVLGVNEVCTVEDAAVDQWNRLELTEEQKNMLHYNRKNFILQHNLAYCSDSASDNLPEIQPDLLSLKQLEECPL